MVVQGRAIAFISSGTLEYLELVEGCTNAPAGAVSTGSTCLRSRFQTKLALNL